MIDFKHPEALMEVMKFAASVGAAEQLIDRLDYLCNYADSAYTAEVYMDWAPHSLCFALKRPDGSLYMNGGVNYHGPTLGTPEYAVPSNHRWSVNT